MTLTTILLIVAFIMLLLAALGVPTARISLGWMGLALWLLAVDLLKGVIH